MKNNTIVMLDAYAVRACKQARVLKKLGYKIIGLSSKTTPYKNLYEDFKLYCTYFSLASALSDIKETRIAHIHHEPPWMVSVAKKLGYKVIMDVGDTELVRTGSAIESELNAFEIADALIFNSDRFPDFINELGLKLTKLQTTLYAFNSLEHYLMPNFSNGGIVYEGNIQPPWTPLRLQYRNTVSIAEGLAQLQLPFHIYPSGASTGIDYYKSIDSKYVILHPSLSFEMLLVELTTYHWGFIGCNIKHNRFMDNVVTHKLFDYIAAGIPIIVFNAEKTAELVKEWNIGIVVESLEEVKERYDEWKTFYPNVLKMREEISMESQIHKVTEIYKQLMEE